MAPFDLRPATRLISRIRQALASARTYARMDGWMEEKHGRGGKTTSIRGSVCSKQSVVVQAVLFELLSLREKRTTSKLTRAVFVPNCADEESGRATFYGNKASFCFQLALYYKNRYFPR